MCENVNKEVIKMGKICACTKFDQSDFYKKLKTNKVTVKQIDKNIVKYSFRPGYCIQYERIFNYNTQTKDYFFGNRLNLYYAGELLRVFYWRDHKEQLQRYSGLYILYMAVKNKVKQQQINELYKAYEASKLK